MKLYRVIEDCQGGTFAMGIAQSANEWLEQMLDWRDSDGSFGNWDAPEEDTMEGQRKRWQQVIAEGHEQELIDYIAEIWQLEFETINEGLQDAYRAYLKASGPTEGNLKCFCEWLDDRAEQEGRASSRDNADGPEYFHYQSDDREVMY